MPVSLVKQRIRVSEPPFLKGSRLNGNVTIHLYLVGKLIVDFL